MQKKYVLSFSILMSILIGVSVSAASTMIAKNPRASVIYGDDNRKEFYQVEDLALRALSDSTVALVNASDMDINEKLGLATLKGPSFGEYFDLCREEPFYEQPSSAFCSGFLVGEDTLVTAGHCVTDQDSCNEVRFVFGFKFDSANKTSEQVQHINTDEIYGCKKIVYRKQESYGADFAVIKLDRAVSNHIPLEINRKKDLKAGDSLVLMGHPSGIPLKIADGASVRAADSGEGFFVANTDSYGGNSGSAVFNMTTGLVEGILVRGEGDFIFKNDCRISNRCENEGCMGEEVTSISAVIPYLGKG